MASLDLDLPNELLADSLRALEHRSADLAAVKEAIADLQAGDTDRRLTDVAAGSCRKHGWFINGSGV